VGRHKMVSRAPADVSRAYDEWILRRAGGDGGATAATGGATAKEEEATATSDSRALPSHANLKVGGLRHRSLL
jgi:hypothetical protein